MKTLLMGKRCIAKARSGEQCKSAPVRGKKKCLFHTGDNASQLGSKGGHRRAIYSPDGLTAFDPPKNAADLRDLLAVSIVEIRSGKLDPKLANSISYLGMGFLKAVEISDLEARLAALEKHQVGGRG
jgi:hypothetical protein